MTEKDNEAIATKLEQKLEEYEAKEAEETARVANLFNIDDFIKDADEVFTVETRLGLVRYKRLTLKDTFELPKIDNSREYAAYIVFLMLNKADPNVTFEKVCSLSSDVSAELFSVLAEKMVFLPRI